MGQIYLLRKRNKTGHEAILEHKCKLAYRTKNNLGKLLKPQNIPKSDKYEKNGIYQIECLTCHKKYTGEAYRPFRVRYRGHYNDFKYSRST
jgi:hypothetical protein